MAKEILVEGQASGINLFALIRRAGGDYWTGSGNNFAGSASITVSAAAVALTPDATFAHNYYADFPAAITTPGVYTVRVYQRAGGSPAASDLALPVTVSGAIRWSGAAEVNEVPAETTGRPTDLPGMMRRVFEMMAGGNKKSRDRATGIVTLYGADNVTPLQTHTQATAVLVDSESKGA